MAIHVNRTAFGDYKAKYKGREAYGYKPYQAIMNLMYLL